MIEWIIRKSSLPFEDFWSQQVNIGHDGLFFGVYLENGVFDIQQTENSWQEGHKLSPGDDILDDKQKAYKKESHSQKWGTPVGEDAGFHVDGLSDWLTEWLNYLLRR